MTNTIISTELATKFSAFITDAGAAAERDEAKLDEKIKEITPENIKAVMLGASIVQGLLGITIIRGLTRIFTEVLEGEPKHELFKTLTPAETADTLAVTLASINSNVYENLVTIEKEVQFGFLLEEMEAILSMAEVESGATIN